MRPEHVTQVRRFNRLVTQRAGALDDHFLGRDRPLGESRLLYEIGREGANLRDLRSRLGLDSGYVSRLVQSLAARGLVRISPVSEDERIRRAALTRAGLREFDEMNRRSDEAAASQLEGLTESQRDRLVHAMAEVERLLKAAGLLIERVDPASPPARWCVQEYFKELAERFEKGFDPAAGLPVEDAELIPPRGAFLLASVDGEPVACGSIKTIAPGIGYVKRMWVASTVRGLGVGRRMLHALETEARYLGFDKVCLETNRALGEAIRLYRSSGYREVAAFNDEPYADHWFEKDLDWS
jgi:DNA-binding MarR family transcriptional regulator